MYYSKKKYEKALERYTNLQKQSKEYQLGISLDYETHDNMTGYQVRDVYKEQFGEPVDGSSEWKDFLEGTYDRVYLDANDKFLELGLNDFVKQLKSLLEQYDVDISFGCGCCDAGISCGDLEFKID